MKYKIMAVDDSRVVLAEMAKALKETEVEIIYSCRSGEEAISSYESVQPDLVTMDIVMPGMDGLEASREILSRWPDAKILMVSSLAYDDTIEAAASIGAKGFLFKPFGQDELVKAIYRALAMEAGDPETEV